MTILKGYVNLINAFVLITNVITNVSVITNN